MVSEPAIELPRQAWWRRALPLLLAVALLAFVISRLDLGAFGRSLSQVSHLTFFALAVGSTLGLLSSDSLASVIVYRWTVAPLRYWDFLVLRGASYLPSLLNHHVGQAFLTYFISKSFDVKVTRVAGATLVGYASWAGCILGAGTIALAVEGDPKWLALLIVAGLGYFALLRWRPAFLEKRTLLAPLFEVGVLGHCVALIARVPHFLVMFLSSWAAFELFDVHIPFSAAAVYVPMLMVAATLPITPQGLGTRDAFASVVFLPYASGATDPERLAQIAASTLSWGIGLSLVEAGFGVLLMRRAMAIMQSVDGDGVRKVEAPTDLPA